MADRIWVGVDGSFSTTTNWNPNGFADGDRFFFTGASQQPVTTDLSHPSISCSLFIGQGYNGAIGNSAVDALDLGSITQLVWENGVAERHITGTTITELDMRVGQGLPNMGSVGGGNMATVVIRNSSGGINIAAGTTLNGPWYITGSPNMTVTIPSGITISGVVFRQMSGTVDISSSPTTGACRHELHAGRLLVQGAAAFDEICIYGDGPVQALVDHRATGTIAQVRGFGPRAKFDGSRNQNLAGACTITASEGADGFIFDVRSGLDTYDLTNDFNQLGGASVVYELSEGVGKA